VYIQLHFLLIHDYTRLTYSVMQMQPTLPRQNADNLFLLQQWQGIIILLPILNATQSAG